MKKLLFYLAFLFGMSFCFAGSAQAQFVVSDPGVEGQVVGVLTELGTANGTLTAIAGSTEAMATTMAEMLRILHTPTPLVGLVEALDGGAHLASAEKVTQFMPALAGFNSVTPSATAILEQLRGELLADEGSALISGNSEEAQVTRRRLAAANIQGMAFDDVRTYGARFLAADALDARLSTATDIKQAVTLNGGIEIQILKGISMLGQTNSLIAAAIAQQEINLAHETLREEDDHSRTALLLALP